MASNLGFLNVLMQFYILGSCKGNILKTQTAKVIFASLFTNKWMQSKTYRMPRSVLEGSLLQFTMFPTYIYTIMVFLDFKLRFL